jgi:hypothetical protein
MMPEVTFLNALWDPVLRGNFNDLAANPLNNELASRLELEEVMVEVLGALVGLSDEALLLRQDDVDSAGGHTSIPSSSKRSSMSSARIMWIPLSTCAIMSSAPVSNQMT